MKINISYLSKEKIFSFFFFSALFISIICYSNNSFSYTHTEPSGNQTITLLPSESVSQKLQFNKDEVDRIDIKFNTFDRTSNGDVIVTLYENDQVINRWVKNAKDILDKDYSPFYLEDSLFMNKESRYWLKIENQSSAGKNIALYKNINSDDLSIQVWHQNTAKKHKFQILSLSLLVAIFFAINRIKNISFMIVLLIIGSFIFFKYIPLGNGPDFLMHVFRIYDISQGNFITPHIGDTNIGGNYLPEALTKYADKNVHLFSSPLTEYHFVNTAVYSPFVYFPQILGMKVALLFTDHVRTCLQFSRGFAALTNLFLNILALRIIPSKFKSILFIALMFPMALQLSTTISPDGFTISIVFLFIALILNIVENNVITKKHIILISILCIFIAMNKLVYLIIIGLIYLIQDECYRNNKEKILLKYILPFLSCIFNLVWLFIARSYLNVATNPGVDSRLQLFYILEHPIEYFQILWSTFMLNIYNYTLQMIGGSLGALNIPVQPIVYLGFIAIICLHIAILNPNFSQGKNIIIASIIFIVIGLISTSLYIQWTPYKNSLINGIQGRYFIPIFPLVLIFISNLIHKGKIELNTFFASFQYMYGLILFLDLIAIMDVIHHFL